MKGSDFARVIPYQPLIHDFQQKSETTKCGNDFVKQTFESLPRFIQVWNLRNSSAQSASFADEPGCIPRTTQIRRKPTRTFLFFSTLIWR